MPSRLSLIFQCTTKPENPTNASAHTGGWTESLWNADERIILPPLIQKLARARAVLLPNTCSIVGARQAIYTILGNKLMPGGTSGSKFLIAGNRSYDGDVPQMALELSGQGATLPNGNRFTLRGIPDKMVTGGEYDPSDAFKSSLNLYRDAILGRGNFQENGAWSFPGRSLTNPVARVDSIAANGIVTLSAVIPAVANVDYLRLRKVRDDNGIPVTGTYLITLINGRAYTLAGLPAQIVTKGNGTARVDSVVMVTYGDVQPSRIVVRKIGSPLQRYRGKASKRRVA